MKKSIITQEGSKTSAAWRCGKETEMTGTVGSSINAEADLKKMWDEGMIEEDVENEEEQEKEERERGENEVLLYTQELRFSAG